MMTVGMGAVFALGFLAVVGIIIALIVSLALCFFAESMVFLGIWIHRKRKKLDCQKVFKVFFIICLSLSIATVVVPVTAVAVGIIDAETSSEEETPEHYVDTDILTEEDMTHIDVHNDFTLDGVKYIDISGFGFDGEKDNETVVANPRGEDENIYEVENDSGKRLLRLKGKIYCAEDDFKYVIDYYENLEKYDYYFHPYDGEYDIMILSNEEFEKTNVTDGINIKSENRVDIKIPDDAERYYITRKSYDKVYYETREFVFIDDRVYVVSGTDCFIIGDDEVEDKIKRYDVFYKRKYE